MAKKHTRPPAGGGGAGTPFTITTLGLPNGQVSAAYSQTITASGGTTPYTFAVTSCSGATGCPPAGVTLASGSPSATLAGTPTADGIYSFTVRATDAAAHTYSLTYALTVAPAAAPGAILFSDGFESGNFAAWDFITSPSFMTVQSSIKHLGSYAAQIHYTICGDSANPACGAAHQDINRWMSKILPGQTHVFIKGWVYFKSPEPDATPNSIIQRKLIWLSDSTSAGGSFGATGVSPLLGSFSATGGVPTNDVRLVFGGNNSPGCGLTIAPIYDLATLNYNTWYSVEEEIQLNTPSVSDGIFRLWIDGVQVKNVTNYNYQGTCNMSLSFFSFGRQADRNNYNTVDEYRYWDDIVISTSYIGP